MLFSGVQTRRNGDAVIPGKSQRAYDWVHTKITDGSYAPGQRLVLSTIADELDMSVVPVREALRRLEAEGMITFERNIGARVALVDEQEYLRTMQTIAIVEAAAIALAAPFMTESQLRDVSAINRELESIVEHFDSTEFATLNRRFHDSFLDACPNQDLANYAKAQHIRLSNVREDSMAFTIEGAKRSVAEHDELISMIRNEADPFEIERLMRAHRLRTRATFIETRHE